MAWLARDGFGDCQYSLFTSQPHVTRDYGSEGKWVHALGGSNIGNHGLAQKLVGVLADQLPKLSCIEVQITGIGSVISGKDPVVPPQPKKTKKTKKRAKGN